MAPVLAPVEHIRVDKSGCAWVEGTTYKVIGIVLDHLTHGWSPEEICYQHDHELALAQVHAALSYYYDHQKALDAQIARQQKKVAQLHRKMGQPAFVKRLTRERRIP